MNGQRGNERDDAFAQIIIMALFFGLGFLIAKLHSLDILTRAVEEAEERGRSKGRGERRTPPPTPAPTPAPPKPPDPPDA